MVGWPRNKIGLPDLTPRIKTGAICRVSLISGNGRSVRLGASDLLRGLVRLTENLQCVTGLEYTGMGLPL